jgi:hypothetical protein
VSRAESDRTTLRRIGITMAVLVLASALTYFTFGYVGGFLWGVWIGAGVASGIYALTLLWKLRRSR